MAHGDLIERLIDALRCLPGVGPRTAQRMTWHLLERNRDAGRRLAAVLADAMDRVGHCRECRTLTEQDLCPVCSSPRRDRSRICVVENPADVARIEAGTDFRGVYFVLMGNLSPLDGIGPGDLGLDQLARRLGVGGVAELVLATGATAEGEATAHYLAEMAREHDVTATRIAQGVPLGGDLEFVDSGTLAHAFSGRREIVL
ncbi:MAG: recombination mediator RecR [Immundisolibacterales bacterium]|nr:recombination mediator RecR [Immundisolibacterales bacterium]